MFFERTVLDGGLTVITEKVPGVRSITMGFWFQVGSRDERPEQAGMSHFMEHMMFKGTPTRDALAISADFEGLGAEVNAFTSREYTCYYARFVDEKLPDAFSIMADMLTHSLYADDCVEFEREVVIEEIARGEDTPEDHVWDLFSDALMPINPLGRPVVGTREIVGGFTHDDLVGYRDEHYTTGNLTVVLVGNVDHGQAVALAEQQLGALRTAGRSVRPSCEDDAQRGIAFLAKETEQAHVIYGFKGYPAGHPDRFAATLLECALGGGMSSRLFQEVREKRGLAYAVFCQAFNHTDTGEFAVYAGTRPANLEQVVEIISNEVEKVRGEGITSAELSRVRDYVTGQLMLSLESTRSRMSRIGKCAVMNRDILSVDELLEGYRAVTLEDVARVASDIFERKPTLAIISPHSEAEIERMFG